MARKRYTVAPDGDDWTLKSGGRTIRRYETKEPAVQEGARRARNESGESQLQVRRKDGTIQEERTYKNDPFPPRG